MITAKQKAALQEAVDMGRIFQLPETRRHHPNTLAVLVRKGFLRLAPVGVVWLITDAGREVLNASSE